MTTKILHRGTRTVSYTSIKITRPTTTDGNGERTLSMHVKNSPIATLKMTRALAAATKVKMMTGNC